MNSIAFPDMFSSSKVKVFTGQEAIRSNVRLVLLSKKNELFGDPDFGSSIIKLLWEQNTDEVVKDVAIDYIYSCITTFIPQLFIQRKDINIRSDGTKLYIEFSAVNMLDYTSDMYSIALMDDAKY